MNNKEENLLFIIGGVCGVGGTILYIIVIMISFSAPVAFSLAILWPLLSIVYAYALYRLIAQEREGTLNRLSFILACLGFTVVAEMLSIQLALGFGFEELRSAPGADPEFWRSVHRALRFVDLGLDVAWDVFIGASLVLGSIPMSFHSRLGLAWGIPSAIFGLLVIGLNVVTFPWPPDTRGLFDIGPFVGIYTIALGVWMAILGVKFNRESRSL